MADTFDAAGKRGTCAGAARDFQPLVVSSVSWAAESSVRKRSSGSCQKLDLRRSNKGKACVWAAEVDVEAPWFWRPDSDLLSPRRSTGGRGQRKLGLQRA
ncbi:hypothetical protein C8035_v007865 [Colletotrichum spinosum]|uniref:Uncharacterized protein n=1 Tax=Colletotrichum spinosum TaxID=1347390 RepID=A0A4R8QM35_9PEZI|nr:hypothetical protein C8035_v007865 [Colletotrichum spinosum]